MAQAGQQDGNMPTTRRKVNRELNRFRLTQRAVDLYRAGDFFGCNHELGFYKPWEPGVMAREDIKIYKRDLNTMPEHLRKSWEAGMYFQDLIEQIIKEGGSIHASE